MIKVPLRHKYGYGSVGYGLGALFRNLSKYVRPLMKTALRTARPIARATLKELKKDGLQMAANTAADLLNSDGVSTSEILKRNLKRGSRKASSTAMRGAKRALSASASQVSNDIKRQKGVLYHEEVRSKVKEIQL